MSELVEKLKHSVFEEESPGSLHKPSVSVIRAPSGITSMEETNPLPEIPATDNPLYKTLCEKTDFLGTDVGKLLQKCLDTFSEFDEAIRPKAALAMAKSHDPQIAGKIKGVFGGFLQTLQNENAKFLSGLDSSKKELEGQRQTLEQLQTQITQLVTTIRTSQAKINSATDSFAQALITRKQELEDLEAHYNTILEGK